MALVTPEEILVAGKVGAPHAFFVKAWNCQVYLRDPSMADRGEWETYVQENKGKMTSEIAGKMAAIFLCNAAGDRLYTDEDIPRLNKLKQDGMTEIFTRCVELLTVDESQIEAIEGN